MDCNRESNLGDESPLSHDENSDPEDEIRDCDSDEEGSNNLNKSKVSSVMDYGGGGGGGNIGVDNGCASVIDGRSPEHNITDMSLGHHLQFPTNQSLGALENLMGGIAGLHNLPNLQQRADVLEELKMLQVRRGMNVGLMDQEYPPHSEFSANLTTPANTAFSVPPTNLNLSTMFDYQKPRMLPLPLHSQSQQSSQSQQQQQHQQQQKHNSRSHLNGFSYGSPNISCTKDDLYAANPGSNSSASSEASNSSQQNNGWSFEEQYKQVRQLYEINDDPKRKEFLDDLFSFMQKRGTPINRLPIMAKSVLDLYELYNLVIARGGLVDVINKKLWQEIIKGLHLPSSITSAAFTLRTQYMKYLYPYECEKKNLSSPSELQAAIDGNRREGRRSSYGQFEAMHNQLQQMPQMQRPNVSNGMQQISPLALVTHANQQSAAAAAAAAVAHHRLMAPPLGQMPNIVTHELEQRMIEYLKLFQPQQNDTRRSQSPEITSREALNALERSRVVLWSMYKNNTSPPSSVNTSPQGVEPQREALNLSESPPSVAIKRERQHSDPPISDRDDFDQPPTTKKRMSSTTQEIQQRENISKLLPSSTASSSGEFEDDNHINNPTDIIEPLINGNHYNNHKLNNNTNSTKKLTPLSSPVKNRNGGNSEDISFQSGMQFKVTRIANGANDEQQLVVYLELNGIQYEGVLFANTGTLATTKSIVPLPTTTTTAALPPILTTATTTTLSSQSPSLGTNSTTNRTLVNAVKDTTLDDRARSLISS